MFALSLLVVFATTSLCVKSQIEGTVLLYGSASNCDADYTNTLNALNYTYDIVSLTQWETMNATEFSQYNAFVICDFNHNDRSTYIDPLDRTKEIWSPLVTGNILLIGTDEGSHGRPLVIQAGLKFVLRGSSTDHIGLYFSLSEFYET